MAEMFVVSRLEGPALPPQMAALAAAAGSENIRIPARVIAEWTSVEQFDRPGEALLGGWRDRTLAGIGGLTHDPAWPTALRMRRFYVRPEFRRHGLARTLALRLLASARGRLVTVNASTPDAPAFWEALGFVRDEQAGHTHRLVATWDGRPPGSMLTVLTHPRPHTPTLNPR